MSIENTSAPQIDFNTPAQLRMRKFRALKDKLASGGIAFGGISVIVAIVLIFFYLLYEVMPLFQSAHVEPWQKNDQAVENYAVPGTGKTLYLSMEEQAEIGVRVSDQGEVVFFNTLNGSVIKAEQINVPANVSITTLSTISDPLRQFAIGFSNGDALVIQHDYSSSYPDGNRVITPSLVYPLGKEPIHIGDKPLKLLGISHGEENWNLIGGDETGLTQVKISVEENIMTGEVDISSESEALPNFNIKAHKLLLLPDRRWLMIADKSKLAVVDLKAEDGAQTTQVIEATKGSITDFQMLLGGNAVLIADDLGKISQWFLVRDEATDWKLTKIREFTGGTHPIVNLSIEHRRKGFASLDTQGTLRLFNTTAQRNALTETIVDGMADRLSYAPRSNAMLVEKNGQLSLWAIHNEHPDVSWSALWDKVWYEGYEKPEYIWQSSAANNDFEPKYSLVPLAFGTLKAAFYAMLLGTPLAICGAIYTAYFMVPALRRKVKPFIELMEALPTVILGFLAGLWLAPFMEDKLAGIFVILLVVPIAIVTFGFLWAQVPDRIRFLIPEGWDALLLVPVVILATLFSLFVSDGIESLLFGGDMRLWMSNELDIPFDQRNALVVGIAMGFAVIPTIFSITEDAIFAVPKHLSYGSLALGATPWQTLTRVVLPTASPGIFSALMIGMGRAVGETMIVLMATGNTPIMDMNIFEGMRTLAANIAVEMPESEVGSTHYRILFLAAFVLFMFTFVVNTLAELVRQRLRKKYGSL
ncbi:ABC transporter permease subunit [Neptunomonas qingdaonensis]|uniref:Phosphate transport system permease protein n=1 Tax=Neptunomonas qingdaonensis TaxID=1045558 RepID=A0A1I2W9U2_9GAMM|nr:ABC transporter permease subunit [Neptunomonas qingdaonensis]SFG97387.1 phosphate transport system permease protein [Neptunomonas qingdaonensis]